MTEIHSRKRGKKAAVGVAMDVMRTGAGHQFVGHVIDGDNVLVV